MGQFYCLVCPCVKPSQIGVFRKLPQEQLRALSPIGRSPTRIGGLKGALFRSVLQVNWDGVSLITRLNRFLLSSSHEEQCCRSQNRARAGGHKQDTFVSLQLLDD